MSLFNILYDFCAQYGFEKTYYVAFSGGLDSHVLLHLCSELRAVHPIKLRALHVNHGLNKEADAWATHCATICNQYNIEFAVYKIHLQKNTGASLEEYAREERYAIFQNCMDKDDILLTAHHQDDQAETVLLQLLRGAGVKGLAAMPRLKKFANGFHGRPLLHCRHALLQRYAEQHHLKWIHDDSNLNQKIQRNFIRHEILPLLETRWPSVKKALTRVAAHCAEVENILMQIGLQLLENHVGSKKNTLSLRKLLLLSAEQQKLLLRTWIQKEGHVIPSTKKLETILQNVLPAAQDKMPRVCWGDSELRRFRDDLYLFFLTNTHDTRKTYTWDFEQTLHIPHLGTLHATKKRGSGLNKNLKEVAVSFRRGGEMANILKRGRRTLKNLFQEWNIPPWQRDQIPLIFFNNKLISAVGYFVDPDYAAKEFEIGYDVHFKVSH